MTPPLHTTQAVFPAEPDRSLLGHQAPADDEHARQSARKERRSKERRSKPSKDSESGSSVLMTSDHVLQFTSWSLRRSGLQAFLLNTLCQLTALSIR